MASPKSALLTGFAQQFQPERTVLLLGAGASIPSGAPSGADLAHRLSQILAGGAVDSDDLSEAATLLEARSGREALVKAVRDELAPLKPDGGLLALAAQPWRAIYTTNFDRLVERAYRHAGKALAVVRSNFEFSAIEREGGTPLFKLHGCISQDISMGHVGRVVLTESDYELYSDFREILYDRLALDLLTCDVLIIGQSLRDQDLRNTIKRAVAIKDGRGAPGRVRALVYEADEARAELQRQRGIEVALGGLNELIYALDTSGPNSTEAPKVDDRGRLLLKPTLRVAAIDIDQALNHRPDVIRMYNGRAASYADIATGATFVRTARDRLVEGLMDDWQIASIVGVAGVGKSTLARQVLCELHRQDVYCWEHVNAFPLDADEWLAVEGQLASADRMGAVLVDDCSAELRDINRLVDRLAALERRHLLLLLTASTQQWRPRLKSKHIFARGHVERLSRLTEGEIRHLVTLVNDNAELGALVEQPFAALTRSEQERTLRERASADMYVCLKNVFGADELDHILLTEFADLESDQQDVYRLVSGLQSIGAKVHRQLVLRYLEVRADEVKRLLEGLEGVVDEYDIAPDLGLYGWEARHQVIAETIAKYKYSEQEALYSLLDRVIDHLNPSVRVELRTIREMCNAEMGIRSVHDPLRRLVLFERLVKLAPGERIPRHRVIGTLLDLGELDRAAHEIKAAEETVGLDRPIHRYKVRLGIERARRTPGILNEDRLAILRRAESLALEGVDRYGEDKFAYSAYADVGEAIARLTGDITTLSRAIERMDQASDDLLDPMLEEQLKRFERTRREVMADWSRR